MNIGIVGLGLIGSSIAKCLKDTEHTLYGFDDTASVTDEAIKIGIISQVKSIEEMSNMCDLLVLCIPSKKIIEILDTALSGTAIVTDVASVKKNIFDHVATLDADKQSRFFGGHPMAGSEQSGITAGRADLFKGRLWISIPPSTSDLNQFSFIKDFISALGAEQAVLSASEHDELVAYASHLPQIAASTLMDIARIKSEEHNELFRLTAGGFRDMTRVASSNPRIWNDIVSENYSEITKSLDVYIDALTKIREEIKNKNAETINSFFERSREARIHLPENARLAGKYDEIVIVVKNVPGTIENVLKIATDINIYSISIEDLPGGQEGMMKLLVELGVGNRFGKMLKDAGYEVSLAEITAE